MPHLIIFLALILISGFCMGFLVQITEGLIREYLTERERIRNVIPIDRLIRRRRLREEMMRIHQQRVNLNNEIENYTFPIKECIIIVNPDNNICLGVK